MDYRNDKRTSAVKHILFRMLSIICTIALLTANCSELLTFAYDMLTFNKSIVASDGKTYMVTVNYTKDSGLPDDAKLEVTELINEDAAPYLDRSAPCCSAVFFAKNIASAILQ